MVGLKSCRYIWQMRTPNKLHHHLFSSHGLMISLFARFKKKCFAILFREWLSLYCMARKTFCAHTRWNIEARGLWFQYVYVNKNLWQIYIISFYRLFFELYLYNVGILCSNDASWFAIYLYKHIHTCISSFTWCVCVFRI